MKKVKSTKNIEEYTGLSTLFPVGRTRIGIYDFTKQIDRVYPGLGIPTLYGVLSILANKSVFYIGGKGVGKTRIIKLVPNIPDTEVSKWDTFTYSQLANSYGCMRDKHLVFKVEEFSTFRDYHKKQFLTTACKLVSDGSFYHYSGRIKIDIQNCKLTMLIAIQPRICNYLCTRYTEWEALSSDRFTKFILLNPLRTGTLMVDLVPTLPRKIKHSVAFHSKEVDFTKLVKMFRGHVSEGRAELYAKDYTIALAKFMGAESVEQKHVNIFYQLFYPFLEPFSLLQRAESLDEPVEVKTSDMKLLTEIGKYKGYVTKEKLAKDLYVVDRSIERPAKRLLDSGLIEKPSKHAGKYRLSEKLRKFFQDYESGNIFPC